MFSVETSLRSTPASSAGSVLILATSGWLLLGLDDHLDRLALGDLDMDDLDGRPDGPAHTGLGDRPLGWTRNTAALEVDAEVEAGHDQADQ